ncbi:MAG: iron-containing alcohol dehydrogenase, partial [Clostridiales bacterium]|nr:iron-containing alcohol dehydrogenase [Clostridiales bacterium]
MGKKALIVTSPSMVRQGHVKGLKEMLKKMGIGSAVFDDIRSEPTDAHVKRGTDIYKDNECDCLIAIGGGSPIDCAKAIGAMLVNTG